MGNIEATEAFLLRLLRRPPLPMSLSRSDVFAALLETLNQELAALERGARASFEAATDPDSRAENKYDTRTLEASYVARGQAQRVAELQEALHHFQGLAHQTLPSTEIRLGSLVTFDDGQMYVVGPAAGGTEVNLGDKEILVITPSAPLGQKLMGKKAGDVIELRPGIRFRIDSIG